MNNNNSLKILKISSWNIRHHQNYLNFRNLGVLFTFLYFGDHSDIKYTIKHKLQDNVLKHIHQNIYIRLWFTIEKKWMQNKKNLQTMNKNNLFKLPSNQFDFLFKILFFSDSTVIAGRLWRSVTDIGIYNLSFGKNLYHIIPKIYKVGI